MIDTNFDSNTIDLEFFIDPNNYLSVKIPWATGGYLSLRNDLKPEEIKEYTGLSCWDHTIDFESEFSKSYESIFLKKHEWGNRENNKYICKNCKASSTANVYNSIVKAFDKVRDTCTQYKFEKFLVSLAISCRDDLMEGSSPITFHLDNLPHQFVELKDLYDMWQILKS